MEESQRIFQAKSNGNLDKMLPKRVSQYNIEGKKSTMLIIVTKEVTETLNSQLCRRNEKDKISSMNINNFTSTSIMSNFSKVKGNNDIFTPQRTTFNLNHW